MNTQQPKFFKLILPFFTLFNILNILFIIFSEKLDAIHINHTIVLFGNALFFALALLSLWLHLAASKNPNPNILVRSVMGSTLVKMLMTAIVVLIYTKVMKENKSTWGVIVGMVVYLFYMLLEVKIALRLNKK
jgi:hypothetical protein